MSVTTGSNGLMGAICSFYRHTVLGQVEEIKTKVDPVSILAVIALLSYKESGTLIGFKGYQITTEQPSDYIYGVNIQGVFRRVFCEGREDLDIIPSAIKKAADWFHPEKEENKAIRTLLNSALKGLKILQKTYQVKESGVTVSAISKWQQLITDLTKIVVSDEEMSHDEKLDPIRQKIKNLWSLAEIQEVNSLINQMKKVQAHVSPDIKVLCLEQIERLEFLLNQKARNLQAIYEA